MTPAASLDLFVLSFNCAKNIIDVDVFARHLRGALQQHGQRRDGPHVSGLKGIVELPDLVVFSLQEISPLAQSFVGGYLLNPYLMPFKEALNLAAIEVEEQQEQQEQVTGGVTRRSRPQQNLQRSTSTLSTLWRRQQDYPYKLVESRNVGMTAIMLFARKPDSIHHIQYAECAFGIADMGNKGAVALRVTYSGAGSTGEEQDEAATESAAAEQRTTEFTFVATHLAAMEYNLRRRNANWASIVSSCTFVNPKEIVSPEYHPTAEPGAKNVIGASTKDTGGKQTDGGQDIPPPTEDERAHLLKRRQTFRSMPKDDARQLHDASIFKPGSHFFVAGDLNYRISTDSPPALAPFPTLDNYLSFFEKDQLTRERRENRTLHGLSEAEVKFPPTYKIKHLSREKATDAVNKDEIQAGGDDVVPWKWASHRWPGWCDRILYLDIPSWVKRRYAGKAAPEIVVHKYNSMPTMLSSDHQPVFLRVSVPLLTPEELSPDSEHTAEETEDAEASTEGTTEGADPRLHLPVPVDLAAWERRASARKKELMTGMTTLFFSTREGAIVLSTVAVVSLMTWWLYKGIL
ncbi:inositol 5-phosphatase [Diaporthe amygdali]|uniref:inositol 5-phosphatase n=1 Tax=Phomopsis amygdali TaxID=1214568 RepID=UPI0022FF1C48|nr:inositol 5-phosphatase [Diaporthe amygdali]KAJ0123716.1 inositol 5-phosphatase [Diaporthe amygdali]